jgi:hypothetical protein
VTFGKDKYRRPEWERRFKVRQLPDGVLAGAERHTLDDLYLPFGRMRLRRQAAADGNVVFKLTQKLPGWRGDPRGIALTTIYLDAPAYEELHAVLKDRGHSLRKVRHRLEGYGGLCVDIFEGPLHGVVLAEIEFEDADAMSAYAAPDWCGKEVTEDSRYTGFVLARDGLAERSGQ